MASLKTWITDRLANLTHTLVREACWPVFRRRLDHEVRRDWHTEIADHANPLLRAGAKYFSQFDEDGILLEILKRLDVGSGSFIEIGVGDGTENNTIILLALGWSGIWVGNDALAWTPSGKRLVFRQATVTRENIVGLLRGSCCDVLSVDIDGNDYWVVEALLGSLQPRVLIVEYNAKFPPPISFVMPYDPAHRWNGTDYFGASFMAWVDRLSAYDLVPVCCSYSGTNAFFVRRADVGRFDDVPKDAAAIYRPPVYVAPFVVGHPTSPKTVEALERRE